MNVYPRPPVLTAVIHESLEKRPNKVYKAVDPLVLKLLKNVFNSLSKPGGSDPSGPSDEY